MADITSVDLARRVGENLEQASPDLLRAMVTTFAEALMGAEADAICGGPQSQPIWYTCWMLIRRLPAQLRSDNVQVHPVDRLDLEHHMPGKDISGRTR